MGAGSGGTSGLGGARRYEETKRILDRQTTVMSELRNRANILLAADAIVATLFGASALGKGHLLGLEIAALVAFGLGIGACVAILWPVHDDGDLVDPNQWRGRPRWPSSKRPRRWQVTFEPDDVVDFEESPDAGRVRAIRDQFTLARLTNWETIRRRNRFLVAASVLLAAQIGLWSSLVLT
jgi:hypothetical protein